MENEVVADGAVKVKKNFSTMFFLCVCVCVGRAPENNDGQGWKQTKMLPLDTSCGLYLLIVWPLFCVS